MGKKLIFGLVAAVLIILFSYSFFSKSGTGESTIEANEEDDSEIEIEYDKELSKLTIQFMGYFEKALKIAKQSKTQRDLAIALNKFFTENIGDMQNLFLKIKSRSDSLSEDERSVFMQHWMGPLYFMGREIDMEHFGDDCSFDKWCRPVYDKFEAIYDYYFSFGDDRSASKRMKYLFKSLVIPIPR